MVFIKFCFVSNLKRNRLKIKTDLHKFAASVIVKKLHCKKNAENK